MVIDIKFPEETYGYKYIWVSYNGKDYVRFRDIGCEHRFIVQRLESELKVNSLDKECIMDAGDAIVELEDKVIRIMGHSEHYRDRFNPTGFKTLIESNTDFSVKIDI